MSNHKGIVKYLVYNKKTLRRRNKILRLALPVLVMGLVFGGFGYVGYRDVWAKKSGLSDIVATTSLSSQQCNEKDSNICKFQEGWKTPDYYSVSSRKTSGGVTSQTTYATDGKKYQLLSGNGSPGDVIVIDNVRYVKGTDGTWYRQSTNPGPVKDAKPVGSDTALGTGPSVNASYKYLATEPCGSLTCLKYEVIDSSSKDKQYIWFDTKDYQLRRTMTISPDSTVNDSTISYDKVVIEPPADAQDSTVAPAPADTSTPTATTGDTATPPPPADTTAPTTDQPTDTTITSP